MVDVPLPQRSPEQEAELVAQIARDAGIDLDDPSDRIGRLVRIGLSDLNPERVLRNCQSLFISMGHPGLEPPIPSIPTTGRKWLHCTQFGQAILGRELDQIYAQFRHRYCDQCKFCTPHQPDWKWTRQWQQAAHQKHQEFVERARALTADVLSLERDPNLDEKNIFQAFNPAANVADASARENTK